MTEPDQAHFESMPWCLEIIKDPDFVITPTFSRQPKLATEDSLTSTTLKTNDTIQACLSVYKRPPPGVVWIDEVRSLMTLGTGMNGAPFMLHGGIVATLMDDVVGTLMTVNETITENQESVPLSSAAVTAYMNVQYRSPITTPQTVLVIAKSRDFKGRKFYLDSEIRDEYGHVLASAESLWISVGQHQKRPKERL
jgi:acyl-coenzyme A thioesterase PaaI-like protein